MNLLGNIGVGVSSTGYWKFQHAVGTGNTDALHWIYNVGPVLILKRQIQQLVKAISYFKVTY